MVNQQNNLSSSMLVEIEKLVFGGTGIWYMSMVRSAFVWNALPGETVEIEILQTKTHIEGVATKI